MDYTFFVDESGQSGIKKIGGAGNKGASPYMTLGGVLVPNTHKSNILSELNKLIDIYGKKDLHCSRLNHNQICRFARVVALEKVKLFGVISHKATLGTYRTEIKDSDKKYYNKCVQYLLERLAHFLELNNIEETQVSIVFEDGNYDYSALKSLIRSCRRKPMNPASKRLVRINPNSISSKMKEEEPLLQVSDLVAHALYRCVDDSPSTYGIQETRYVDELRCKFFSEPETQKIVGYGLFPVHRLSQIKASKEVETFLEQLKSY